MYLGSWMIDDWLTFQANTHIAASGAAADAVAAPSYRVYEDETTPPILTGTMALLDSTNTTGFYTERIQLTSGNGFEKGKCYTIYVEATVAGVTGTMSHTLQIEAEVDANSVSAGVNVTQIEGVDATDQINAAVDAALDTAIPGSPTANSINERIRAMDLLAEAGGSGDLAVIKTASQAVDTLSKAGGDGDLADMKGTLDTKLAITGVVASSAEVTAIQNNTRVRVIVPSVIERPDSGSTTYKLNLYVYDEVGSMEAPDSAPTLTAVNQTGADRSGNLGTITLVSTGHYAVNYVVTSGHAIEQLLFEWTVVEGGATRLHGGSAQIVDTTAVDFTAADRTKLDTLHDTRITAARAANLDDLDVAVSSRSSHTATDAGTDAASKVLDTPANKLQTDAGGRAEATLEAVKGTALTEPSAGRLASNISTFWANDDQATTNVVDDVGGGGASGSANVLHSGTAQGGATSTITLDTGAAAQDGLYENHIVHIHAGTGAGQAEIVDSYVGATRVCTMSRNWTITPDATSQFRIIALGQIPGASAPSAATVAAAVFAATRAGNDAPNSMGEAINNAHAQAANLNTVDRSTGDLAVYEDDNSTVRYTRRITEISDGVQGVVPQ